ncbi:50S ribosomal protein L21 [Candidatus Shapirobacteria bacterium RBG_13_44_7]|uniref:Large ribosomal subunit protein bL21 n=1 Tax=Candidatus Shapirobacteria bacterium RBG_13_44_7 TaxID=1802149 RepID=A0A1F7SEY7_9BACT|nr:MAG: 50S ribosomal protein L21 [Candidatus Shapirobacteria bacterium RBG_13_44_7]
MKYAVIAVSGSQYQISENDTITIDHLNLKEGDKGTTDQVLLLVDDQEVNIGQPTIPNVSIDFQVLKNYQGNKVRVFKYKAKSRYHKTQGFRSQLTDIKILKINSGKSEALKKQVKKTTQKSK